MAVVERLGTAGIGILGLSGVVMALAAIPAITPLAADVALVLLGLTSVGGASWAWATRRRMLSMPLELAPTAGRGFVDGAVIYRFRARLGHGRALRDPDVRIAWLPAEGDPVDLAPLIPARSLCGPFTLVVRDDRGIVRDGALEVRVTVRSGGRTWEARASYPVTEIATGRFGGVSPGRVRWNEAWATLEPEE